MADLLKRTLPERIWRRLGRNPVAVVATLSMGVKVGKDGLRFRRGEIDGLELRKRTGGHLGSMSGGIAGAAAGAAWGSVLPGLGTMVGAFAGGLIGEELGGRVGRLAVEQAELVVRERVVGRTGVDDGRSSADDGPSPDLRPPRRRL